MNNSWKQDPRVKAMNPQKIQFLLELTQQIEQTPKDQLLMKFMTINMEAGKKGIHFTDQETELLVSILSANMSQADRNKLDTLKMLAKKMQNKSLK